MLYSSARGGRRVRSVAGVLGDELRMMRGITLQHPADSEAGRTVRPAVGHGSGVDCGGYR